MTQDKDYRPDYNEKRSAHALAIDRAINAKVVYSSFTPPYKNNPNRSDVEQYDTRYKTPPQPQPQPSPKPTPKPESVKDGEYKPSKKEFETLRERFYQNPIGEQIKDLLTTRNVVKNKNQVERWKKNTKDGDIRGIDTQPTALIPNRLNAVQNIIGNIPITYGKVRNRRALGEYQRISTNRLGEIHIQKKIQNSELHNKVLAHELGHAFDYNVLFKKAYQDTDRYKENERLGNFSVGTGSQNVGYWHTKIGDVWDSAELVTRKRIFPYDEKTSGYKYHSYRTNKKEIFANWFEGLITRKEVVKKHSKPFYNKFKNENKELFGALRKSDFMSVKPFLNPKSILPKQWNG